MHGERVRFSEKKLQTLNTRKARNTRNTRSQFLYPLVFFYLKKRKMEKRKKFKTQERHEIRIWIHRTHNSPVEGQRLTLTYYFVGAGACPALRPETQCRRKGSP